MTDPIFPPRLTESSSDDAVRGLLQAGRRDAAEPDQARDALATYLQARSAPGEGPSSGHGVTWRLPLKLLGTAILAGSISLGWTTSRSTDGASSAPRAPIATGNTPVERAPSPLVLPAEPPTMQVADLPSAAPRTNQSAAAPRTSPVASTTATTPAAAKSLRDELALVEAARSALAKSEPGECLHTLDVHDHRYGDGILADEVAAMRIEALIARGERERALVLGNAFLAAKPASPYALRIQSLLAPTR